MTKLLQWLSAAIVLIAFWTALLATPFGRTWSLFIIPAPFILLILFGIYAATVVLYRVYTFNDCPEAAEEIRRQIKEARADLGSKGIIFERSN